MVERKRDRMREMSRDGECVFARGQTQRQSVALQGQPLALMLRLHMKSSEIFLIRIIIQMLELFIFLWCRIFSANVKFVSAHTDKLRWLVRITTMLKE